MQRRTMIKLAGGGVVLAASAAWLSRMQVFGIPASATAAWREAASPTEIRRFVLAHALLAPNPHNMQPWIADLSIPGEIVLRLDTARLLPATDPFGRQILMGIGGFLELLDMAAAARGHRTETQLFPEGAPGARLEDGRAVARIRLHAHPAAEPNALFAGIAVRRTERQAYDPARPPSAVEMARLQQAAAGLPVRFGAAGADDPTKVAAIRTIARAAWKVELLTEPAMMESMHVLRVGSAEIDRHRDGIALTSPLVVTMAKLGLFDRTRFPAADSSAVRAQIDGFDAVTASTPAYFWLVTEGNTRALQIAAGRAYARVALAGAALGLAMHPNQQSLQEYPEVATHHQAIHALLDAPAPDFTVQMLARLGTLPAAAAPAGPAPRRGLAAFATPAMS